MATSELVLCQPGTRWGCGWDKALQPCFAGLPSTSSYGAGSAQLASLGQVRSFFRPSLRKPEACTLPQPQPQQAPGWQFDAQCTSGEVRTGAQCTNSGIQIEVMARAALGLRQCASRALPKEGAESEAHLSERSELCASRPVRGRRGQSRAAGPQRLASGPAPRAPSLQFDRTKVNFLINRFYYREGQWEKPLGSSGLAQLVPYLFSSTRRP